MFDFSLTVEARTRKWDLQSAPRKNIHNLIKLFKNKSKIKIILNLRKKNTFINAHLKDVF